MGLNQDHFEQGGTGKVLMRQQWSFEVDGKAIQNLEPFLSPSLAYDPHEWARALRVGQMKITVYYEADFKEVFRRYIPRAEFEALKAEWAAEKERGEEG